MMKNREEYYDQLRALAIFSIICCHAAAGIVTGNSDLMNHFKTFYAVSFVNLGRFIGIPIFVMLSGALLINKDYSLSDFIKKRFNRVFVPYIFWLVIFLIFSIAVLNVDLTYEFLISLVFGLKGTVGRILWFVWMLVFVYIAIFIINKILSYGKSKSGNFERKFINVLVILSLICYVLDNFGLFNHGNYAVYYSLFIPYAVFGYYLTHTDFTDICRIGVSSDSIAIAALALSILGYLYFVYCVCIKSIALGKYSAGSYFEYVVLLTVFAIILFFRYLPHCSGKLHKVNGILTSDNVSKAILSISKCSYGIYFAHYLILNYLQVFYLNPIRYYNDPIFWTPVLVIAILLSSWILIWIMGKIPYVNKLSGAS